MKREDIESIRQASVMIDAAWNNDEKPNWPQHIVRLIRTLAEQAMVVADVMEKYIDDSAELYDAYQLNNQLEYAFQKIETALQVPAAEYVPAIQDAFDIIDKVKKEQNS